MSQTSPYDVPARARRWPARLVMIACGLVLVVGCFLVRYCWGPEQASADWRERLNGGGELLLLYAGRLVKEKNVELLYDIFRRLSEEGLKAKLLIVGEGNLRESLQQKFRQHFAFQPGGYHTSPTPRVAIRFWVRGRHSLHAGH